MIRVLLLGSAGLVMLLALVMGAVNIVSQTQDSPALRPDRQTPHRSGTGMDASAPNTLTQSPIMDAPNPYSGSQNAAANGGAAPATGIAGARAHMANAAHIGDFIQSPTMPNGQFVQSPVGNLGSAEPARGNAVGSFYAIGTQGAAATSSPFRSTTNARATAGSSSGKH